jgi:hypothetical protein
VTEESVGHLAGLALQVRQGSHTALAFSRAFSRAFSLGHLRRQGSQGGPTWPFGTQPLRLDQASRCAGRQR